MAPLRTTVEIIVPELCCADEAREIEQALTRLDGVIEVGTAIGVKKAIVSYDPARVDPEALRHAIRGLGMTTGAVAGIRGGRRSLPELLGWAFVSVVAVVALLGLAGERLGLIDALTDRIPRWLSIGAIVAGGYPIFRNVARALRNRRVTSHALMTLGIAGALVIGQYAAGAVIVFFMRFADFLEDFTTERSRRAIKELLRLAPETARVERDGQELELPAGKLGRGDIVLIKPGERIPVDGVVLEGHATVNQSAITGESVPVEARPGAQVFAATICERGALRVRAERVGPDTTFGQILKLVEQAETAKAPVQRFADRFTAYYIPVVVAAAILTYLIGGSPTAAIATVLVACSCAIAMATPVTVLASVGQAAKRGIIIKGGRYLEALAKVDTLVMDKTGTVTIGRPEVTDIIPLAGDSPERVLATAASVERLSEHPLAAGILRLATAGNAAIAEPTAFEVFPGEGASANVDGEPVLCGTEKLMERFGVPVSPHVRDRVQTLAADGKSIVLVARAGRILGLVALADLMRPEVSAALDALRRLGVSKLLLLTGDRQPVAAAIAGRLGIAYEAEVLPEEKIGIVRRLQADGHVVAMVGDGINDAPALAQADVGIAMGVAGTDAAIEAAHVALMQDDWRVVPEAIAIGRRAFRTIKQNLWFTAGYNVVGIALAAAGWLPPIAAAAAQSLPDVVVMLNSSRLLRSATGSTRSMRAKRMSGLIMLWAFWFWSADPMGTEEGWVAMATREACETAREQVRAMATIHGPAGVSACHRMTAEELRRKRHEPPADSPKFTPGF
jgi:Cd2+/Zn2+-exporting ATPase/Cu+-exporting ATPase